MNMKKAIIIMFGLMILYVGNKTTIAIEKHDLETLASGVKQADPDADITGWALLARSSSNTSFDKIRNRLERELPNYNWTLKEDIDHQTLIGKNTQETLGVVATIKVMSVKSKTYLLHSVEGKEWTDKQTDFIRKHLQKENKIIFKKTPLYFACIKGLTGDTMDKVLLKNWMSKFEAKPLESAIEDDFVSVASNSRQFEQTMANNVNLQIAFRKNGMGEGTRFTIGTPIIAFEY